MHNLIRQFLLTLIILPVFLTPVSGQVEEQSAYKRILVIYGGTGESVWDQDFSQHLQRLYSQHKDLRVTQEFLWLDDLNPADFHLTAESIRLQYQALPLDLITAVGPTAVEFLLEWGSVFPEKTPKLLAFPLEKVFDDESLAKNITLMRGTFGSSIAKIFLQIPQLFPDLEQIVVISGDSPEDIAYLTSLRLTIDSLAMDRPIHYLIGLSPAELRAELQGFPNNSAIYLSSYNQDQYGNYQQPADILTALSSVVEIPVFGLFANLQGRDRLGGIFTNIDDYAELTMAMSLKILNGDSISDDERSELTSSIDSHNFVFDAQQLKRFSLSAKQLPQGSLIINVEPSFWQVNKLQILISVFIILVQIIFLVALYQSLRTRKKIEIERDRTRVEQENQVRLFEAVIGSSSDAIVITDKNSKIVETNQLGLENIFGYREGELIGENIAKLVYHDINKENPENFLMELSSHPSQKTFYTMEGSSFHGEFVGTKLTDADGQHSGYLVLVRDISKRINQEQELRQAHKMEALGNLAGGIAHDFHNILMVIVGSAEVAKFNIDRKSLVEGNLANILRASGRAKELINQILTFSRRSEENSLTLENLENLLNDFQKLLNAFIPSGIKVKTTISPDLWGSYVNTTQIQQLLLNLCSNAQHAMHDKGVLEVCATNRSFAKSKRLFKDVLAPGNYVELKVSDTGVGIEKDIAERIFEPFFTTKPQGEGTGMGLALVYGIVESHNAHLDLKSEVGKGTSFSLFLPAVTELPQQEFEQPIVTMTSGKNELIMLVDDDSDVIDITAQILQHLGYLVETYTKPEEALISFKSNPDKFDLVVSDQTMPKLDGLGLLAQMQGIRANLPTILCTGYREDLQQLSPENLIISSVLLKPFAIKEISEAVKKALQPV